MFRKMIVGSVAALGMGLGLVMTVGAQSSYSITVSLDETTRGDLDVVGTSMGNSGHGSEMPRSVRRLATSAAGELSLVASQRIAGGNLTLDDGTVVPLMADDEVTVSVVGDSRGEYVTAQGTKQTAPAKSVVIVPAACGAEHCSMKPAAIIVIAGGQCRRAVLFAHPPVVMGC